MENPFFSETYPPNAYIHATEDSTQRQKKDITYLIKERTGDSKSKHKRKTRNQNPTPSSSTINWDNSFDEPRMACSRGPTISCKKFYDKQQKEEGGEQIQGQ